MTDEKVERWTAYVDQSGGLWLPADDHRPIEVEEVEVIRSSALARVEEEWATITRKAIARAEKAEAELETT